MVVSLGTLAAQLGISAAGSAASQLANPLHTAAAYQTNSMMPMQLPSPEDVIALNQMGYLSANDTNRIGLMHGRVYDFQNNSFQKYTTLPNGMVDIVPGWYTEALNVWARYARAKAYTPTIDETLALARRKLIALPAAERLIREQCGNNSQMSEAWMQMRFEIPGSSDLIRFAVREAFDPATVQRFDYHKELPAQIIPWMEKQGYGQDTGIPRPAGATDNNGNPMGGNCTWSDLYWYSHWELPSLTQGYEMYHRLYPNSRYGISPDVMGGNTFTGADLEALQKAQDIPNYWRQRLQSISFHPLTRIDTKRMFESDIIDKQRVYHTLRSGGYNDRDANDLANWFEQEKIKKLKNSTKKIASDYICTHLHMGTIDEIEARRLLDIAGYAIKEQDDFINKCDLKRRSKTIEIGLGALKNSYIQGGLSETELRVELTNLGVSFVMVQNYVTRWNLLKSFKYKLMSATALTKSYQDYLITDSDMVTKLSNLGYPKDEVYLILNSAKAKRTKTAIAAAKATLASIKASIKEANRLAKERARDAAKMVKEANKKAEALAKKRIRGLIEGASDKNIAKWYEAGLVMIDEIAFRLILRDYSLTDVKREIQILDPSLSEVYIDGEISKAAKVYIALGYPAPTA